MVNDKHGHLFCINCISHQDDFKCPLTNELMEKDKDITGFK